MTMTVFWLIVVAAMLVAEIISMGLTTIWFCIGAVVAAIASGLGAPIWLQIVLFVVISVVVMVLVRPMAKRILDQKKTKTNINEVIGEQVKVLETIDNAQEKGKVLYHGVEWTARSVDGKVIQKDEMVTVEQVSGVKLMVKHQ